VGPAILPAESDLITALDDPRREVRDAVIGIVKAGGPELYPKATEAVAAKGR